MATQAIAPTASRMLVHSRGDHTAMSQPSLKTVSPRSTGAVPLLASFALLGLVALGFAGPPAAMGQLRRSRQARGGPGHQDQVAGGVSGLPARRQRAGGDPDRARRTVKEARVVDAAVMAGGMDGSAFANNQYGERTDSSTASSSACRSAARTRSA